MKIVAGASPLVKSTLVGARPRGSCSKIKPTMTLSSTSRDEMDQLDRRQSAFHEAGHLAAHAFFCHEWSHIEYVTIQSNQQFAAHFRHQVSECTNGSEEFDLAEAADQICIMEDETGESEIDAPGSDLYKVVELARLVERRFHPERRQVGAWVKLTVELMDIEKVWNCVDAFARHLLKVDRVERAQLDDWFRPILGLAFELPKWRRRIMVRRSRCV